MTVHTTIEQPGAIGTVVSAGQVSHAVAMAGAPTQVRVTTVTQGLRGEQGMQGDKGDKGAKGDVGPSGGDRHYTHSQAVPDTVWTVTHNLGKYPSITVFDSSGAEVEGEVAHLSNAALTVTFSAGFSGYAYAN